MDRLILVLYLSFSAPSLFLEVMALGEMTPTGTSKSLPAFLHPAGTCHPPGASRPLRPGLKTICLLLAADLVPLLSTSPGGPAISRHLQEALQCPSLTAPLAVPHLHPQPIRHRCCQLHLQIYPRSPTFLLQLRSPATLLTPAPAIPLCGQLSKCSQTSPFSPQPPENSCKKSAARQVLLQSLAESNSHSF